MSPMPLSSETTHDQEESFDIREVLFSISQYKWSILLITLTTLLIALYSLYFKPNIYRSSTLIEVKSGGSQGSTPGSDFLGGALAGFGSANVDKDIEILKTYHINSLALDQVNFHTRYFVDKGFKQVEIYGEQVPIQIQDATILDDAVIGYKIKVIPRKGGYSLAIKHSLKAEFLHKFFKKELLSVEDPQRIYPYNKPVKNRYFSLTVTKRGEHTQPIYFYLITDKRNLYESIKGNLKIQQINLDAPLIEISYTDSIASRADAYVDAVADSFILQSIAEKSRQNDRIIDFIDRQLNEIKQELDRSEKELEEYRITNQAINPTLQGSTYISELSGIEIELSRNELKKVLIDNLLEFTREGKNFDAMAPSLMELKDQPTLTLIAKLQAAQIKEEGLQAEYSGRHPGLIAVRKQIQYINRKIILNLRNLKSSIAHRNTNLEKLKQTYEEDLKSLPTQERVLINLKRDYQVSSETYKYLLKKKSENEMIKVAILSDYRIIDRAYSNPQPIAPKRKLIIIIFLLVGLILGISQAILRIFMDDRIQKKEDIEKLTSLPIYGILPALKQKRIKLEVFKNTRSPFAESYRNLRTNLQFIRKEQEANVILVTSTTKGEGKSTTVANLGAIFQMANQKSIVINLDLRKPTLHHYFNVKNSAGMSTYLSGKRTIEEVIQHTEYQNLDIIASGPIPPNPSELILTQRLDRLIEHLKKAYDYIFIDSAPLGLVTDTMHLMQYADMSLIVFRENYAKKSFVTDLNHLVQSHKLKHIGIIINSVDVRSGGYGYGYGYGYGK